MSPEEKLDQQFESLLEYLRQSRGFEFTGYKRPSLLRRIGKRMQSAGITAIPITSITSRSIRKNSRRCSTAS